MKAHTRNSILRKNRELTLSWESFSYAFIESGYFEHEDRPKTARAMRVLWESFHNRDRRSLLKLMETSVVVFAPTPNDWAYAAPSFGSSDPEQQMLYFSPQLEKCRQKKINSTVAHEFAHVIFKHGLLRVDQDGLYKHPNGKLKKQRELTAERRADALVKRWGYEAAYACNRKAT